jgi:hypothetical protein
VAPVEVEAPPAGRVEAPQATPPAGAGLPIDAVLARLRESEAAGEAPPLTPPAPAPDVAPVAQPQAPPRRHSWDFMDEEPSGAGWPTPGAEKAPAATAMAAPVAMPPREVAQAPRRARSPGRWLRKRVPVAWSAVSRRLALREALPWMIPAAAFAVAAIAILAVTLAEPDGAPVPSPDAANIEAAPMPEEVVNAPPPSQGRPAFVTASVLSCRSAPARQARRVRNLGRGDAVEVLAREGEWVSVAHRGAQCWTLARFVAEQRPL